MAAATTRGSRNDEAGEWEAEMDDVERPSALLFVTAAVGGTACLTVPAAKRWMQPWKRRRRPENGNGGERPAGAIAVRTNEGGPGAGLLPSPMFT